MRLDGEERLGDAQAVDRESGVAEGRQRFAGPQHALE
jgi:hypothetical protein